MTAIPSSPRPARRRLILVGAALPWLPRASRAADAGRLPTPAQIEGPFHPVRPAPDTDGDLVLVRGRDARATGEVLHVRGRVTDLQGRPVRDALVELWQADARGIYDHPAAPDTARRDPGFQGHGTVRTDAQGRYAFRTIRPGRYPGRTPHLHFKVEAAGLRPLVTQMYFAGEPGNERDFLLGRLGEHERRALVVPFAEAPGIETGGRLGNFDIVLAG